MLRQVEGSPFLINPGVPCVRFSLSAVAVVCASAVAAHADPILYVRAYDLTGGAKTAISLNPKSSTSGAISATGSDGNFSNIILSAFGAGLSNGGLSTTTLDASGVAGGILELDVTQVDLPTSSSSVPFSIAYTLNSLTSGAASTVTYDTYVGKKDAAYGMSDPLVKEYVMNGAAQGYTTSATATGLNAGGLYSETQVLTLNFANSGSISASSQIVPTSATPEPSSLALLGTGLLGAVGVARRRFTRTK